MADEWKPKVGDVVWVRAELLTDTPDNDGDVAVRHRICQSTSDRFVRFDTIRPDAPAPAALDDVAVLRRAAEVLKREGWKDGSVGILMLDGAIDTIEARNRVPTPLEALKGLLKLAVAPETAEDDWLAPISDARRAIAAAEAKGGV
jgi:hypothetical protein